MFKCLNRDCEHIFDAGEEWRDVEYHAGDEGPGETLWGCPICHCAAEETVHCVSCLGEHLADELYDGWCEWCLREAVTFDNFREYLCSTDGGGHNYAAGLRHFMFEIVLDTSVPEMIGERTTEALLVVYDLKKRNEEFIETCRKYVMDGDDEMSRDNSRCDYAEWLNERKRQHDRTRIPLTPCDKPVGAVADEREPGEVQILPRASA